MKVNHPVSDWQIGIRFIFVSLAILAGLYPLLVTGFAILIFPIEAKGSLLEKNGNIVGSRLFAQNFSSSGLFKARPSAGDYNGLPSAASQSFRTSLDWRSKVEERKVNLMKSGIDPILCEELLYSSGSGLDPHITLECAREQARVLGVSKDKVDQIQMLINNHIEEKKWHSFGRTIVNVNSLNFELLKGGYER
ncbi:putative K+-transporting ATPase, C subunit [Leptospira ryugenii]|uniref:Putative K+-transporting ATPase, C subunit n=1 Tax=Leptospira ryugenii TaxID=1917863 RepID=A0A2P2DZN1_9LEPT|nr:potassium-transporting ATPase subunit C [Leptospira ryugenii]GBF50088.1 putative K+-transporting ATPase, C subunit [Leptospira ryugenii]